MKGYAPKIFLTSRNGETMTEQFFPYPQVPQNSPKQPNFVQIWPKPANFKRKSNEIKSYAPKWENND